MGAVSLDLSRLLLLVNGLQKTSGSSWFVLCFMAAFVLLFGRDAYDAG